MGSALITGASGFVGGHLAGELARNGVSVTAVHRPGRPLPADLVALGVRGREIEGPGAIAVVVDEVQPERVFHLAAHQVRHHSRSDVSDFIEANVAVSAHLFDALRGSSAVVVQAQSYFQFREGMPFPHSLYSATKQASHAIADYYRAIEGLDVRNVVLFDNYGPGDNRDKLIPALLEAVLNGRPFAMGPREQPLDLLYIADVVSGLIAAAEDEAPPAPETTVRADALITVGALVDAVQEVVAHPIDVRVDPARRVDDHPAVAGSWPPPRGWSPAWDLPEGLLRTAASVTIAP